MTDFVRYDIVLMAAVHKHEGIQLSENDAKLVMKYMDIDDRYLKCDCKTLDLSVTDARKGWKKATTMKARFSDLLDLAIEICKGMIDWLLTAKDEEERIVSIQEFSRDMKNLKSLYVYCQPVTA